MKIIRGGVQDRRGGPEDLGDSVSRARPEALGGWLAAIPAVGAIFIPYFAVVFANGGREPDNTRGFMEYRPNLPATRDSGRSADANGGNGHRPVGPGSGDN